MQGLVFSRSTAFGPHAIHDEQSRFRCRPGGSIHVCTCAPLLPLQTVDVQAKFVNGKPDKIECKYVMRSSFEWDR